MESQKFSQTQYKIVYLISFIFSFKFLKIFDKSYQFFPCKKAYYVCKKESFFPKIFVKTAFYGVDTESEPEP